MKQMDSDLMFENGQKPSNKWKDTDDRVLSRPDDLGWLFVWKDNFLSIRPVEDNIIHVSYSHHPIKNNKSDLVHLNKEEPTYFGIEEKENIRLLRTQSLEVIFDTQTKHLTYIDRKDGHIILQEGDKELYDINVLIQDTDGEPPLVKRIHTVDGERNIIKNLKSRVDHQAYRGKLYFQWKEEEGIYGLGQGEEGIYNYRHSSQYLYQHNMRIPMPMFFSDAGYGVFLDCGSLMTFNDGPRGSYIFMDALKQMDYYVVVGKNPDKVIEGFRELSGDATMLPRWAFGYLQSKEQYYTAQELEDVVAEYRKRQVPIDGIIQDWNTWEPGQWGNKHLDPKRYEKAKENLESIHKMHVHAMVSIWPNMKEGCQDHKELKEAGGLLNDFSTYNAFDEQARDIYWRQAKTGLWDQGFDAWWCDSTEPFTSPDWNGEYLREPWERYYLVGEEHKKYLPWEKANLFALYHAKGIFEHQRKLDASKRVVNLTRSGYASIQRYGVILWSGDITATYDTMKKQLVEGLNMGLSGYPYWTLDIGGFFVVNECWKRRGCGCSEVSEPKWFWKGGYEDGVKDPAYRELYTRWIQWGAFLPIFRSHGTDTPREIWQFGQEGQPFYDAIKKAIELRYSLMPYIYSLAAEVCFHQGTMMRSLLFDFMEDEKVKKIKDQFMLGSYILVCPVLAPMIQSKQRICYLPKGAGWYDYHSGKYYEGGQTVVLPVIIDTIPIFIKAGAIILMRKGIQYADEASRETLEVHVYPKGDGKFVYYEDQGDGYDYEEGEYMLTPLMYDDLRQTLTIGKREGKCTGLEGDYQMDIYQENHKLTSCIYKGESMGICLSQI